MTDANTATKARTILYFADPMCSWCWGFQPTMTALRDHVGDRADIQIFVGGLRPFTDHTMTDGDKAAVRNHWEHVHEASGQPFDFTFFERDGFTYDTEPACRAIVAARRIDPDKTHTMLDAIHAAFYRDKRDTTDSAVLTEIAAEVGLPRDEFQIAHADEQSKAETLGEFQYTHQSGISGFPTLVGIAEGQSPVALTMGFRRWTDLQPSLDAWLAHESKSNTEQTQTP